MGTATTEVLNDADAARLNERGADWLTKQQAADALGVSTRTIQQLASEGKLRTLRRAVEGGPPISIYDPEDVAREKEKRAKLAVIPQPSPGEGDARQKQSVPLDLIATLLLRRAIADDPPPMNLTLLEASALAGLPRKYLRAAVDAGALPAHRYGRRVWIHRADLEAFRGSQFKLTPVAQPQWSEGGAA
jgi:excisionase family DNA binding protein